MMQEFNCTVVFDALSKKDQVCSYKMAVKALKYYESSPLVQNNLWTKKDIL